MVKICTTGRANRPGEPLIFHIATILRLGGDASPYLDNID